MNKRKFFMIFLISAMIFIGLFMYLGDKLLLIVDDIKPNDDSYVEKDVIDKGKVDKIDFLLVGIDAFDLEDTKGQRSDTMILTRFDFNSKQMNMLSIPRDTRVKKDNGYFDKINHAHAHGGIDYSLNAVNKLFDSNVEYYVRLNYKAVEEVVDAIGGVKIYVPRDMKYDDTTEGKEFHVDLKEGEQTLNGDQAIQFLRWRKNNDGTGYPQGDVGRIQAQQAFLKELIKQSLRPKNFLKLPKFISIYNKYVDTNIPLKTVIRGAWAAKSMDFDTINTSTLPGEGKYINDISYFVYYPEEMMKLYNKMFPKN